MKIGLGVGIDRKTGAGGGESTISPTDVAGLKFWFDPANGVTKDGSNNVTSVVDQSSSAIALDGTGHPPLWVDNELNSNPTIRFNGSTSYLIDNTSPKSKYNFLHEQGTTFFAVVKFNLADPGTRETLLDTTGLSSERGYNVTFDDSAANNGATVFVGNGSSWAVIDRASDTLTPQQWVVWSIKTDPDNATAALRSQHRINGADVVQANSQTGAVSVGDSARFLCIGARNNGGSDLANMDIAEILIYENELSAENVDGLESYLATKYGITLA